ncbi:YgjP-like metallopeptidase domain-containing protein [Streptomyces sp. NPDC056056]|uniref:YgjP-like metallopeptidase domain-containing protein n=1 Tax=Streptomyces sp. NPDC056056 TaxID=3345698 RepID=UPI0035D99161
MHDTKTLVETAIADAPTLAEYVHEVKVSVRRKTLAMTMKPGDPGITVHVPTGIPAERVVALLIKNRGRMAAMLLKARRYVPDHPVKELVGGEGFLWLGRSARLRIVDNAEVPVARQGHSWMLLSRDARSRGGKPLIDWYISEGDAWINQPNEAEYWWRRLGTGRPMPAVRVANMGRTRWGAHDGATNTVRLAWQTFQFPPQLVRHVLVHEFIHAMGVTGPAHGPNFWRAFERARIGAQQEVQQLNELGCRLWMGDTTIDTKPSSR